MAWSYSKNPSKSVLDAVRFEIQDTNEAAALLQDEEVNYAIVQEAPSKTPSEGEVLSAAARCCEVLSRLFAAQADTTEGSLHVTYSTQAKGYSERALSLRHRALGGHVPWAGGQSIVEKELRRSEENRVQPLFRREQWTTPLAGPRTLPEPTRAGEEGG